MRRAFIAPAPLAALLGGALLGGLLLGGVLAGCAPVAQDPCDEAALRFERCGASLAFLYPERCGGASLVIAECVNQEAPTCEALSRLDIEGCVEERLGEPMDPPIEPPVVEEPGPEAPAVDAERGDACGNGLDDDADGYFDCDDLDCVDDPSVECAEAGDACLNGQDDDGDGLTDCDDFGCVDTCGET